MSSGLVVSINSLTQLDEYLYASGQPLQTSDVELLENTIDLMPTIIAARLWRVSVLVSI